MHHTVGGGDRLQAVGISVGFNYRIRLRVFGLSVAIFTIVIHLFFKRLLQLTCRFIFKFLPTETVYLTLVNLLALIGFEIVS